MSRIAVQRSGSFSRSRIAAGSGSSQRPERIQQRDAAMTRKMRVVILPARFVDRHDAPGVQAELALFVVAGQDLDTPDASSAVRPCSYRTPPCRTAPAACPATSTSARYAAVEPLAASMSREASRERASNMPRFLRRKPRPPCADRTSAITVAISPGASCAIGFRLLRSS